MKTTLIINDYEDLKQLIWLHLDRTIFVLNINGWDEYIFKCTLLMCFSHYTLIFVIGNVFNNDFAKTLCINQHHKINLMTVCKVSSLKWRYPYSDSVLFLVLFVIIYSIKYEKKYVIKQGDSLLVLCYWKCTNICADPRLKFLINILVFL